MSHAPIEYPPEPRADDTREEWERRDLNPWRQEQKRKLMLRRGMTCERCGKRSVVDLDEGIVPRCDMRGMSLEQRWAAFATCNLFLLCMRCNREEAHDRDGAWKRSAARYGRERVAEWYESLGLRAPRVGWLRQRDVDAILDALEDEL